MYFARLSVGKVYGCSKLQTFVSKSVLIFVKFKKFANKYFQIRELFLKNVFYFTKNKCSQKEPQLKVKIEYGRWTKGFSFFKNFNLF